MITLASSPQSCLFPSLSHFCLTKMTRKRIWTRTRRKILLLIQAWAKIRVRCATVRLKSAMILVDLAIHQAIKRKFPPLARTITKRAFYLLFLRTSEIFSPRLSILSPRFPTLPLRARTRRSFHLRSAVLQRICSCSFAGLTCLRKTELMPS